METSDKKRKIHIHVDVEEEYAPARKKNVAGHITKQMIERMRLEGQKNIDIWTDGSIYPRDPSSNSTPAFSNLTSLVRFVGDGSNGLLGYCNNFSLQNQELMKLCNALTTTNVALVEKVTRQTTTITEMEKEISKSKEKQTMLGLRRRRKTLSNVERLSIGGGALKRRIKATRKFLHPQEKATNIDDTSKVYSTLLSSTIASKMLEGKKFEKVKTNVVNSVLAEGFVDANEIQGACDNVGISRKAYTEIYRTMQTSIKMKRLKHCPLPKPFHIKQVRAVMNVDIMKNLGDPFHIEETYESPKGSKQYCLQYTVYNNIFYDLMKIQDLMVRFYNMTVEESKGKLIFVLKLDESEIVKGQKIERVSITLMNRALDPSINSNDDRYFSVQCENNIWWLGAFQVKKETHEVLQWVFSRTVIPEVIKQQGAGKKLRIDGYGEYEVEWHLAADLKTLKCMYGVKHGANSKSPCIYCLDESSVLKKSYQKAPPKRDAKKNGQYIDKSWSPVLEIPLKNVHICTLHALCRIVEKLVHLHIMFAWNMKPEKASKIAIEKIERVLSDAGLHGGNVQIEKDLKKSGKHGSVPTKPSIGGTKARRFLSDHRSIHNNKASHHGFEIWKKLNQASTDHLDEGQSRTTKAETWRSLDEVDRYLNLSTIKRGDVEKYIEALDKFVKNFKSAWGDSHIQHYTHILYNHTPWFMENYGDLSKWSTQGMEKSHWQARSAYFRATQHGGGKNQANSLEELFMWYFRRQHQRVEATKIVKQSEIYRAVRQNQRLRKRQIWINTNASQRHTLWRSTKKREGKRWVDKS